MVKEVKLYTKEDLTLAENNLLGARQLNYLLSKTPAAYVKERPAKGGGKWNYVSGVYVKKVLNLLSGWDWDFEVVKFSIEREAKQCIVHGRLTIRLGGKEIKKEQFGCCDIKVRKSDGSYLDLGNDLKAATTDCLKKCSSELGVAGDIYGGEEFREVTVIEKETFGEKHVKEMGSCMNREELVLYYDTHPEFWSNEEFRNRYSIIYDELGEEVIDIKEEK